MNIPETQSRVKDFLDHLAQDPPQVLLLEGGRAGEREALALYWAARLNCENPGFACLACPACKQVEDKVLRDLFFFDGTEGKIKIDPVRELKPVFGQPPRGSGKRVVIFHEAQELTVEAANTLLKSLEEPCPGTVFVLLSPQRERLLPTLVSRSWVLTLAWPLDSPDDAQVEEWLGALLKFWKTGQGWFAKTGAKGALDRDLALRIVLACQRNLAGALAGKHDSSLAAELKDLGPEILRNFDLALVHAQDALNTTPVPVNPALVLDWLATRKWARP
ncbi:MAG: DNA polymerase III subunit delta' [Thermodesulfobacteriota bacterium]|nr:DNA polymerase III subunit delta' [Thermodesulfobacteriota bacterium]